MTTVVLADLIRFNTTTVGTGTLTAGTAVSSFMTPATYGAPFNTGTTNVSYSIIDSGASETGTGVYSASGGTLTRTPVTSTNGNATISLSGQAQVCFTAISSVILNKTGDTMPGALTLQSALTYGGVTLTNAVTGTGKMVLSAAPTITGHPTIEGVTSTGATGTGKFVFDTSPALVTPAIGVATATSLAVNGATIGANALAVTGTTALSSTLTSTAHTITSAAAGALVVGANGTTNPALNIDASTASSATGINIKSAAAAGGVALSVLSSGSAENLSIDAKGSGTITLGGTSTGAITLTRATTMSAALTYGGVTLTNAVTGTGSMVLSAGPTFTGTLSSANHTITSASANALAVGANGTTNPAFNVDASTASSATGLNIKSAAAAGGLALSILSSGSNENLTIDAKGSGTITVGGTSTGALTLTRATTLSAALTYGGVTLTNAVTGTGKMVLDTSPTLATPTLGVATATTVNKVTLTAPATGSTLTIADGKTLTANNSITIAGTDAKTLTLTNGLTVKTNDGTLEFGAASKTLTVSNSLTLAGTDATTMTFPATSAYMLGTTGATNTSGTDQPITRGYLYTYYSIGTFTTGTNSTTLLATNQNYQYVSLSGTLTWAITAPTADSAIDVIVALGASGSGVSITYTGFKTPGAGASGATFTAANNTWYLLSVRKVNGIAMYSWSGPWT